MFLAQALLLSRSRISIWLAILPNSLYLHKLTFARPATLWMCSCNFCKIAIRRRESVPALGGVHRIAGLPQRCDSEILRQLADHRLNEYVQRVDLGDPIAMPFGIGAPIKT